MSEFQSFCDIKKPRRVGRVWGFIGSLGGASSNLAFAFLHFFTSATFPEFRWSWPLTAICGRIPPGEPINYFLFSVSKRVVTLAAGYNARSSRGGFRKNLCGFGFVLGQSYAAQAALLPLCPGA